jgi:hypothetical protein
MGSRRTYSAEFKQEAVQLASQAGVSVALDRLVMFRCIVRDSR